MRPKNFNKSLSPIHSFDSSVLYFQKALRVNILQNKFIFPFFQIKLSSPVLPCAVNNTADLPEEHHRGYLTHSFSFNSYDNLSPTPAPPISQVSHLSVSPLKIYSCSWVETIIISHLLIENNFLSEFMLLLLLWPTMHSAMKVLFLM